MLRKSSRVEYQRKSTCGARILLDLGKFRLLDTVSADDQLHHFVLMFGTDEEDTAFYETDQSTMYGFVARYLGQERIVVPPTKRQTTLYRSLFDTLASEVERAGKEAEPAADGEDPPARAG